MFHAFCFDLAYTCGLSPSLLRSKANWWFRWCFFFVFVLACAFWFVSVCFIWLFVAFVCVYIGLTYYTPLYQDRRFLSTVPFILLTTVVVTMGAESKNVVLSMFCVFEFVLVCVGCPRPIQVREC